MDSVLPEWYHHDDDTLKLILTTGTIALDANVLLDLYRVGNDQRTEIFAVLETVGSRLFVPYQAALEFQSNRLTVASGNETIFNNLTEGLRPKPADLNAIRDRALRGQVKQLFDETFETFSMRLDEIRSEHTVRFEDVRADDAVRRRLDELLADGCVGQRPAVGELERRRQEAVKRLKDHTPPGFKDEKKGDSSGDYLIWAELLEHAKDQQRPLLFVTNDEKADWYREPVRGQAIGPRTELVAEMRGVLPDHPYHQVNLGSLLALAKVHLHVPVDDSTISAVARIPRIGLVPYSDVQWSKAHTDAWRQVARDLDRRVSRSDFDRLSNVLALIRKQLAERGELGGKSQAWWEQQISDRTEPGMFDAQLVDYLLWNTAHWSSTAEDAGTNAAGSDPESDPDADPESGIEH